ncbi:hypothetical protein CEXT_418641 [Caerostris extrusa]|uniref:Uncharacterized protein n=1 Tax=Caerostris extrusa TaxID=172846 RepID=A0AAV4VMM4_CAEEX|nr:hypothetical protein CEXT_418641 [Caerostris extrusa]
MKSRFPLQSIEQTFCLLSAASLFPKSTEITTSRKKIKKGKQKEKDFAKTVSKRTKKRKRKRKKQILSKFSTSSVPGSSGIN